MHLPAAFSGTLQGVARHCSGNATSAHGLRHFGMHQVHNIALQDIFNQADMPVNHRLKASLLWQMLYGKGHDVSLSDIRFRRLTPVGNGMANAAKTIKAGQIAIPKSLLKNKIHQRTIFTAIMRNSIPQ